MANFFEHKDRRVIPNWRSFNKSIALGELNSFNNKQIIPSPELDINEYIIDWNINHTIIHAAELLSAAFINNVEKNKYVIEAANFILSNKDKASKSQISLAYKILNKKIDFDVSESFKDIKLDTYLALINPESFHKKIKETKLLLRDYPYNPVLYVELSRFYSVLGHEEHSVRAMKTALHLAPDNRFILRCATRLFAHYHNKNNDYLDYIHKVLRKSPLTFIDPWLVSAEISIATIAGKTSKFMKKGIELIDSKNISPFNFTELASSIGTVELLHGSTKKSRKLFKQAMITPNDNSLAQIEWASTKDKELEIDPANFQVKMNFEALALNSFYNENFDLALDNTAKWFIDMPYSKRPILFGSNLASTILKDQETAISFLNLGLKSNPNDPQLINNLAYALSLSNRPAEAFTELNKIKSEADIDIPTKICLTATRGLASFRAGLDDIGRQLYLDAIELAKTDNQLSLNWCAILNYAREEIILGSEYVEQIMQAVEKIPADIKNVEINSLRKDIIEAYEAYKQKPKEE